MRRTSELDIDNPLHKSILEYVTDNELNNHAVIISDGKLVTSKLPAHGKVNIVTENGRVTKILEYNSELF